MNRKVQDLSLEQRAVIEEMTGLAQYLVEWKRGMIGGVQKGAIAAAENLISAIASRIAAIVAGDSVGGGYSDEELQDLLDRMGKALRPGRDEVPYGHGKRPPRRRRKA